MPKTARNISKEVADAFEAKQLSFVGSFGSQDQALNAIDFANGILVQVRYGTSEAWVPLSRRSARQIVRNQDHDDDNFTWGEMDKNYLVYLG